MTTLADAIATPSGIAINGAVGEQADAASKSVVLSTGSKALLSAIISAVDGLEALIGTSNTSLATLTAASADSTTASPVRGSGNWETVAASQSDQALGATGATGDYLAGVQIIPATTSPGAVSIKDGSGSAITIFTGGASSVSNLVPFAVDLGMTSLAGAWKVTTGANVSVIAIGKFT